MLWRNTLMTEFAPSSPNERWAAGGSSQTRQYDLISGLYQARTQAALDILGYSIILPNPAGTILKTGFAPKTGNYYIHRVVPLPYDGWAGVNMKPATPVDLPAGFNPPSTTQQFWAQAISRTEPLGKPLGLDQGTDIQIAAQYARARLTVEFTTLPYLVKTDLELGEGTNGVPDEGQALESGWQNSRYIIRQIDSFSRLIKVPYGLMQVAGKLQKTGLPVREGGANVTYTWMRVPLTGGTSGGIPFGAIGAFMGTINESTFDIFEPNTLLFDNYSTREYQGAFGERLADVTYKFIYLPHPSTGNNYAGGVGPFKGQKLGWNYVFDVIGGKQDYYLVTDPSGNPPFDANDFTLLFAPPN